MHLSNVNNPFDYAKNSKRRTRTDRDDLELAFQTFTSMLL
jgi:hypothetical protein